MRTESEPQNRIKMGGLILTDASPPGFDSTEVPIVPVSFIGEVKLTHEIDPTRLYIRRGVFGVEEVQPRDSAWVCPD